ncbi:hypothetical protein GCM10009527_083420 [Actinomadura nitritigenes]
MKKAAGSSPWRPPVEPFGLSGGALRDGETLPRSSGEGAALRLLRLLGDARSDHLRGSLPARPVRFVTHMVRDAE